VLGPVVASAGSEGGSVRVADSDSVQSLLVSWTPPADARGAPVTGYLVEWWTTPAAVRGRGADREPVQRAEQTVAGSFQLGFEGQMTEKGVGRELAGQT
jgi:hypothetical protein